MRKRRTKVEARELRRWLGACLERVKGGETLLVTVDGEPVAELRPIQTSADETERAFERMADEGLVTRGTGGPLGPFKPIRLPRGISAAALISTDREERGF